MLKEFALVSLVAVAVVGAAPAAQFSPRVLSPHLNRFEKPEDEEEASVVTVDASGARLSVSRNNDLTWQTIEVAEGPTVCWPGTVMCGRRDLGAAFWAAEALENSVSKETVNGYRNEL